MSVPCLDHALFHDKSPRLVGVLKEEPVKRVGGDEELQVALMM